MTNIMKNYKNKQELIVNKVFFLITVSLFVRNFYGIDWSDEAYYVELVNRVAMGDRFFIEITDPHQTSAIIMLPFYYIWEMFFKNSCGIILYYRFLYTFFECALMLYTIKNIKFDNHKFLMIPVLACACFSQFSIRSLSYNTISYLCMFAVAVTLLSEKGNEKKAIISGSLLMIATCVYPTIAIFWIIMAFYFGSKKMFRSYFFSSVIAGIAMAAILLMHTDISEIGNGLVHMFQTYSNDRSSSIIDRIAMSFTSVPKMFIHSFTLPGLCIYAFATAIMSFCKTKSHIRIVVNSLFIGILTAYYFFTLNGYLHYNMYFVLAIILFIQLMQSDINNTEKKKLTLFLIFSFIYYVCIFSLTDVAYFVLTYPYIILLIAEIKAIEKTGSDTNVKYTIIENSVYSLVVMAAITMNLLLVYRDEQIPFLNRKIQDGSARGIYTTSKNVNDYENILATIHTYENSNGKIVFTRLMPSGYLDSESKAGVSSVWRYYSLDPIDDSVNTIIIIKDDVGFHNKFNYSGSSIDKFIKNNHMQKHDTDCCIVYTSQDVDN